MDPVEDEEEKIEITLAPEALDFVLRKLSELKMSDGGEGGADRASSAKTAADLYR